MNFKQLSHIILFSVFFLIWGCSENTLDFEVRYGDVLGLKQEDPVYFGQNIIGKVTKVFYTQQADYLVDLSITPEFVNSVTVDSKFYIENDPKKEQGKAVIVVQEKHGGAILANGTIVQGSVKPGFLNDMLQKFKNNSSEAEQQIQEAIQQLKENLQSTSQGMQKNLADALDDLSQQLNSFSNEMQKIPDREEVKQLEKSIEHFSDEFNQAQKNVRDHIQHDIIPQIRKELDLLREQLHEEGRDKEIEKIDKKVDEMSRA
jgi:polyhydroxyalkanoate synthesis regulator phasin